MSHCTLTATLKPKRSRQKLLYAMSSSRKCTGRLFQTRGLAAAKLLPPSVLCVRRTAHDLSVDEQSRRLGPSETKRAIRQVRRCLAGQM